MRYVKKFTYYSGYSGQGGVRVEDQINSFARSTGYKIIDVSLHQTDNISEQALVVFETKGSE